MGQIREIRGKKKIIIILPVTNSERFLMARKQKNLVEQRAGERALINLRK